MKESASSFGKGRLRLLSAEEISLWLAVTKSVSPRPSSVLPQAPAPPAANGAGVKAQAPLQLASKPPPKQPLAERAKAPPLAPLERRLRQKLSRGRVAPDAVIDLHGLRRQEAFVALHQFLTRAQRDGAKLVLVVTGKGGRSLPADSGAFDDDSSGVLRRSVPQWLRGHEYHTIVVGFEEASRPHGGAGALYVRIKRRRPLHE
ncbi:Smr/MutS family protein [Methylocella tundrae]|uniref:DNA mismatch repair protein MutS n=1 Tax=Methylocella tundrae TaxID=227605 RepID=A0A4U8YUS1_METTU|nr:Smr/MutS family protein [Methylocella tundrae]WPP05217.1 Smr/MutS family protein [Methylocella tundrae]VFU07559.1 DNA mismatch repair protein MutS [Methylocella tundrae]